MYFAIAGIVFFATFAMMVQEKIWNNLITLLSILIGGIVAFGVFQPLTIYIDEQTEGSATYLLDIAVILITFALVVGLLKELSGRLSQKRVKFHETADNIGGAILGAMGGYLLSGIVMASLHTAPLAHDSFSGKFIMGENREQVEKAIASTSVLTRPDLAWLLLMENVLQEDSLGAAGFSAPSYVHNYAEHRKAFGKITESIVKRRRS